MIDIAKFLYEINETGFFLWLDHENIKYRQYNPNANLAEIKNYIKANKQRIIDFLNLNKISQCPSISSNNPHIYKCNISTPELSYGQERLWFIDRYEMGTYAYNIPMLYKLKEGVNIEVLERSIRSIIARHEILRTTIREDEEANNYQEILATDSINFKIQEININSGDTLNQNIKESIEYIFNLSEEIPIKVYLFNENGNRYICIIIHHIAFDGWSVDIFLSELLEFYQYHSNISSSINLPALSIQYGDFAIWQKQYLKDERFKKQLDYWKQKLEGHETLNLITDRIRPQQFDYIGKNVDFSFNEEISERLRLISKKLGVSLYSVLLSGYYLMLGAYSNQKDILIGTVVANRHYSQIEHLIGFFVNSLVLRVKIQSTLGIKGFIELVGREVVEAQLYQDLPFEKLVEELKVEQDTSRHPIFQIMFVLDNFGTQQDGQTNELLEPCEITDEIYEVTKFDILTTMNDSGKEIKGVFNYATSLFKRETIEGYIETYKEVLIQIACLSERLEVLEASRICDINYISKGVYEEIIFKWNSVDKDIEVERPIIEIFEKNVVEYGDSVAVIYGNKHITYSELNKRANLLASFLLDKYEINFGDSVVIHLDRSEYIIISLLATLKLGAAYVPIDPSYPEERIQYIIKDTKARVVVTNNKYQNKLLFIGENNIEDIEEIISNYNKGDKVENLNIKVGVQNLAYIMYTSGTTGKPKGTMVSNLSYMQLIELVRNKYLRTKEHIRTYSITNYVFDIFGLEYGIALYSGGSINIGEINFRGLDCNYYDFIQLTPSLCEVKLMEMKKIEGVKIFIGGEELRKDLLEVLLARKFDVVNMYGPVETCIWSTSKEYEPKDNWSGDIEEVSIGRPFSQERVYVLGKNLEVLPVGAVGELYISGIGLGIGYINKQDLTAERFIANPFRSEEEYKLSKYARMYKTGDMGRWLPGGDLEYIGREDLQVKIRGHRVELYEIEGALQGHHFISQSVAIVDEQENKDGEIIKNIVGYYVASEDLEEEDLLVYLKGKLPEYMIPNILIRVEEIPLTLNGKVDKKALPKPLLLKREKYVAPSNEIERKLCNVWSRILGIKEENISIFDNFFKLGGNSILAIKLISLINKELQSNVEIKYIYSHSNIKELSKPVKDNQGNFKYKEFQILNDEDNLYEPFRLSNTQQAYYIGRNNNYELGNTSTHIYVEYKFKHINIHKLEQSLNQLIDRHHSLRTIFKDTNQRYLKNYKKYKIKVNQNINEDQFNIIRNRLSKKIYNPLLYPLFDFEISILNGYHILHISFDALIMDDSSFEMFLKEWTKLYREEKHILPNLKINFRDYIIGFDKIKNSTLYFEASKYWNQKLYQYDFNMMLPLKVNPYKIKTPKFKRITKVIPRKIWDQIINKSNKAKISPTSIVLEIFGQVLSYWTGQTKLAINLTLFNRLPLHEQINDIIGDFTVIQLFNYNHSSQLTVLEKLKLTHDELWSDIENNLFDGIDFQRLLRQKHFIKDSQIVGPVVLTSTLGNISNQNSEIIDSSYISVNYSITQTSQVWIDNKAYETEKGFVAEWDYVEQLFDQDVIYAMHNSYCSLLQKLSRIDWEKELIPVSFISNQVIKIVNYSNSFTQNISTETLFGRCINKVQLELLENKIAVIDSADLGQFHTYGKLLKESRLLAEHIHNISINNDSGKLVGILSEKGYNQVVGTFSIMQSCHGYLPLDTEWPEFRITEILSQAKVSILLISKTQHIRLSSVWINNYHLIVIEDTIKELNSLSSTLRNSLQQLPNVKPEDIAYVIYTSGSTGIPKGVTISHQGALNTIDAVNNRFSVSMQDKVLAISKLSFDLSVYDIYGILAVGGTIIFSDSDKINNPEYWVNLVNQYNITIWNSVPQLADLYIDAYSEKNHTFSIRLFLLSGDWIPLNLFNKIKNHSYNTDVISLGGATEGSIWSIWYRITRINKSWKSIPYGFAMPNQKVYVLNYDKQHCPIGVIGELYIGGIGVALGYWQDDDKTNISFIKHPKLGNLYKTGDLGRWNKNGYIEFIGRQDTQVKINGYRIELEEISSKLTHIPGIEQAVVKLQKENQFSYLVGYLLNTKGYKNLNSIEQSLIKIEQQGLIKNLQINYKFNFFLDESKYKNRKSYRNFVNTKIHIKTLELLYGEFLSEKINELPHALNNLSNLKKILSTISALKIKNKPLPKYLYPSAGSSYSIRCFVNIPYQLDDIKPDYYYYDPILYSLNQYPKWSTSEKNDNFIKIHLVVYWPAIKPLYNSDSKRLVYIEVGHMVRVIESCGVKFETNILESILDSEHTHIATLTFGNKISSLPIKDLEITYLEKEENVFYNSTREKFFNLIKNDIFFKASYLGQLLDNSNLIIELSGEKRLDNYVASGYLFEKFSEFLNMHNIGSCMLGLEMFDKSIYSMVVGYISPEHKKDYENNIEVLSLKDIINKNLSKLLPTYMLPDDYIVLDKFPTSSNGKLEINKLPLLQPKKQSKHMPPRNQFEDQLCKLWSEVLNLEKNNISITDNFFALGGNSLLAMQLVRKASSELGINCTIKDLYQSQTIKVIYERFGDIKNTRRNIGVI